MTILQTLRTRRAKRRANKARARVFRALAFWSGVTLVMFVILASVATLSYLIAVGLSS
jgi:hypothetical protein